MTVDVAVRLGLKGGAEVEKSLGDIGRKGSAELRELRKAAGELPAGLKVVSRSVAEVKDRVDDMVASTGAAGRILGGLGPLGTATAVGVAAVGTAAFFTFSKVREALSYADEIGDTAAKIGVTTDALQEYQYILQAAGGEASDAAGALESFNIQFGAARSGLSAKAIKPFEALGFTEAELQKVRNGSDLIPEIAERIKNLGSTSEQAAVADKLGLTAMLPALRLGRQGIEDLRLEVHNLGGVIDAELITKGGDANHQLEVMSGVIRANLTTAFLALGPILIDLIANAQAFIEKLREIIPFTRQDKLRNRADELVGRITRLEAADNETNPIMRFLSKDPNRPRLLAAYRKELAEITDELGRIGDAQVNGAAAAAAAAAANNKGNNLQRPDAAKATRDAAAAKEAADLARRNEEAQRVILGLMGEEERAAYDLAQELKALNAVKAEDIGMTPAQIEDYKALAHARYEDAKAARAQAAAAKERQAISDDLGPLFADMDRQSASVASLRTSLQTPKQARDRQIQDLKTLRDASSVLPDGLKDGEYEQALKRINTEYDNLRARQFEASAAGNLLSGVLRGQIRSWEDLGNFALDILAQIIEKWVVMTIVGGSGGGGGGILGLLGLGLATGGPEYGGRARWVGERGPEVRAPSSDGYIFDAATSASMMRAQIPPPGGGAGGGGAMQVVLNNYTGMPMRVSAREERDAQGNSRVVADVQRLVDDRIEDRFTDYFDRGRDDLRAAGRFGLRRRLTGG